MESRRRETQEGFSKYNKYFFPLFFSLALFFHSRSALISVNNRAHRTGTANVKHRTICGRDSVTSQNFLHLFQCFFFSLLVSHIFPGVPTRFPPDLLLCGRSGMAGVLNAPPLPSLKAHPYAPSLHTRLLPSRRSLNVSGLLNDPIASEPFFGSIKRLIRLGRCASLKGKCHLDAG